MRDSKQVVALKYNEQESAPSLVAKGRGFVGDKIIAEAKEHNIPIQEDPSLVAVLSQLEIHQSIPEELYEVVAEIFAFVYTVDKQYKKRS